MPSEPASSGEYGDGGLQPGFVELVVELSSERCPDPECSHGFTFRVERVPGKDTGTVAVTFDVEATAYGAFTGHFELAVEPGSSGN